MPTKSYAKLPRYAKQSSNDELGSSPSPHLELTAINSTGSGQAEEWDRIRAETPSPPLPPLVLARSQRIESSGIWEWLPFFVLGLGPGWVMLDCMFVEVPYFQAVQPEGLKLASRMSVAASLALAIMAPLYLYFRDQHESELKQGRSAHAFSCISMTSYNFMVPTLTCMPLVLAVVASFTWDSTLCFGSSTSCNSMAIYIITFIASTVGTMQTIVILPWMTKSFAPHHISAIMSGSNFGSMLSAVLGNCGDYCFRGCIAACFMLALHTNM